MWAQHVQDTRSSRLGADRIVDVGVNPDDLAAISEAPRGLVHECSIRLRRVEYAAGAVVDGTTIARAKELGLDAAAFLRNNDSYHFFEATGDLIKTGPTGTNVADIQVILAP